MSQSKFAQGDSKDVGYITFFPTSERMNEPDFEEAESPTVVGSAEKARKFSMDVRAITQDDPTAGTEETQSHIRVRPKLFDDNISPDITTCSSRNEHDKKKLQIPLHGYLPKSTTSTPPDQAGEQPTVVMKIVKKKSKTKGSLNLNA